LQGAPQKDALRNETTKIFYMVFVATSNDWIHFPPFFWKLHHTPLKYPEVMVFKKELFHVVALCIMWYLIVILYCKLSGNNDRTTHQPKISSTSLFEFRFFHCATSMTGCEICQRFNPLELLKLPNT